MGKQFKEWIINVRQLGEPTAKSYLSYLKMADKEIWLVTLEKNFFVELVNLLYDILYDRTPKEKIDKLFEEAEQSIDNERNEKEPLVPINSANNCLSALRCYKTFIDEFLEKRGERKTNEIIKDCKSSQEVIIKYDGIDSLPCSRENICEYVVENTLFIKPESVKKQMAEMLQTIKSGQPMPVRYSKNNYFFKQCDKKRTLPRFKYKGEAVDYTNEKTNPPIINKETLIPIYFDSDGNSAVREAIKTYTGHSVSCGKNASIINYTIAHIIDKLHNPIYFSSLWNICLVPRHIAFLTDISSNNPYADKVIESLLSICDQLYGLQEFLNKVHNAIIEIHPEAEDAVLKELDTLKSITKYNFKNDDIKLLEDY